MITIDQVKDFNQQGYIIARNLFTKDEVDNFTNHYMTLRAQGSHPGDFTGVNAASTDPLKKYPRMIHMHRWDQLSLDWLIDPRIGSIITALTHQESYAVQTMIYFKPTGARGQALHQDQYYLRAQPGTCLAAWMALDPCDDENGCLTIVPGSQNWPLLCTIKADTTRSFTDVTVPIPAGMQAVPMIMQPGDVLFFNGQVVHGSGPNRSENRFRRSLIGHYVAAEAREVAKWFHPALRLDGSVIELDESEGGGSCGVWVDTDGQPVIELVGVAEMAGRTE